MRLDWRKQGVTFRAQTIRCRQPGCSVCGDGKPGHGPYWYAFFRADGRTRSVYIGKALTLENVTSRLIASRWKAAAPVRRVIAAIRGPEAPAIQPRFDSTDPYEVLGFRREERARLTRAALQERHRTLVRQWHPDVSQHPQAHRAMQALNRAYALLRDRHPEPA
jgi:hypothetical protein